MSSYRLVPRSEYIPPFTWAQNPLKGTGTFEIDGNKLTCYLQIKNTRDKAVILAKPMIRSLFQSFDSFQLLSAYQYWSFLHMSYQTHQITPHHEQSEDMLLLSLYMSQYMATAVHTSPTW